uniref:Uncharacterized protein n=1 Tax=Arion vulgaris TaxID=1028688 RepID=A0A0B7BDX2_9EUPU
MLTKGFKSRRIDIIAPGFNPYGSVPLRGNGTPPAESIGQSMNSIAMAKILGISGKSALMNRTA